MLLHQLPIQPVDFKIISRACPVFFVRAVPAALDAVPLVDVHFAIYPVDVLFDSSDTALSFYAIQPMLSFVNDGVAFAALHYKQVVESVQVEHLRLQGVVVVGLGEGVDRGVLHHGWLLPSFGMIHYTTEKGKAQGQILDVSHLKKIEHLNNYACIMHKYTCIFIHVYTYKKG